MEELLSIHRDYCVSGRARMITVYTEEVHAADDWSAPAHIVNREKRGHLLKFHRTIGDRIEAATMLKEDYSLPFEVICDSMDGEVMEKYDSFPDRLYIMVNGVCMWHSGQGPFFYEPKEVRMWLEQFYGESK